MSQPAMTVTFSPGNAVQYWQDFGVHIGLPAGVTFSVTTINERGVELRAPGYGGKPYGDGCIEVLFPVGQEALLDEIIRLRAALEGK